ncbi:MAG: hypothetical protein AB3N20_14615 [Rhizobiaceae bacterium]
MQSKLLAIADKGFNSLSHEKLSEPANVKSLMIYGLTGGNPRTVLSLLPLVPETDPHHGLVDAVSHYVRGERQRAQKAFEKIDASDFDNDIGASVALAIGSAKAKEEPEGAISKLKSAILLAPGTLVEEAALRRLIALYLRSENIVEFIRASERYARRFYRSPYANQFADMLVVGTVGFPEQMTDWQIRQVADSLPPAHRNAVYLRIARLAAVKGQGDLSAQASSFVDPEAGAMNSAEQLHSDDTAVAENGETTELRARLYTGISVLRQSGNSDQLNALRAANIDRLPAEDRKLLSAALAVADAISEPIEELDDDSALSERLNESAGDAGDAGELPENAAAAQAELGALNMAETLISDIKQKLDQIDQVIEKESR